MISKSVRILRIPSLFLAAILQLLPIVRVALPAAETAANVFAVVFRWAAGAAAALGGVQAVSGASTVVTNPLSTNLVQGQSFTMRLTTAPNLAHYWTATGLPAGLSLSGTSGQTLWNITGTPTATGTFSVALTAKDQATSGSSQSTSATLVINVAPATSSPPSITTQPVNQTVTQGQRASFSVVANGTGTLAYQWRFQSASLTGQTSSTLVINPATTNSAGNYDVVVSNGSGSVTSVVATLTVVVSVVAPTITTTPASQTVAQGQSVSFSVVANGTAPLGYQWRLQSANLPGQTSSSLVIGAVTTNNAGVYDVIVSNNVGSITSAPATLTVLVLALAPTIITPPASQTVTQGFGATFTVLAGGTAPLSYYWRKGTTMIGGPVGPAFTIASAQLTDAGSYSVIVSNSAGTVTSSAATLTVQAARLAPFISVAPANQNVLIGSPATFTVTAGGTAPLRYQWWYSGESLAGRNSQTLSLAGVQPANVGTYYVVVANAFGSVTSPSARLGLITTKGTYSGLYYDPAAVSILSSGPLTVTVTDKGKYSGSLSLLGLRYSLSGQFDASGHTTNTVKRGTLKTLTVDLELDLSGADQIRGQVTDGSWTAQLLADRAVWNRTTNPAPQSGTYTLVIPGTPGSTQTPAGNGFGTVKVNATGRVQFTGVLADGTRATQVAMVSKSGDWPFCSSLYIREGSILGWLSFTNRTSDDINGRVCWTRLPQPPTRFYPAGFAFQTDAMGSKYVPPPTGSPVVNFSNGQVLLTDGNLAQSISNPILLGSNNKISNLGSNKLAVLLAPPSGLFTGGIADPATGKWILFKGAVLQKQDLGLGFFLVASQSGAVYLGP
jgi:hypothetical protein